MPAADDADVGGGLALKRRIDDEAVLELIVVAEVGVEREVGAVAALGWRQRRGSRRRALGLGHPTPVTKSGRRLRAGGDNVRHAVARGEWKGKG
jgi:hypothetical protein